MLINIDIPCKRDSGIHYPEWAAGKALIGMIEAWGGVWTTETVRWSESTTRRTRKCQKTIIECHKKIALIAGRNIWWEEKYNIEKKERA
jgi:hypothetical protein